jgi:predicted 3-demethylubiquinone-9 3-methyltransferase (glyoxalase superfamily)
MQKITTFLMFDGQAEDAMNFYTSLFEDSEITSITRYGPNESGTEGTVSNATFSLNGQVFMCIDSSVRRDFSFTPAMSLYVCCDTLEEIGRLFEQLSDGGEVLLPLITSPSATLFGWVADRFGVSWQLNLPGDRQR